MFYKEIIRSCRSRKDRQKKKRTNNDLQRDNQKCRSKKDRQKKRYVLDIAGFIFSLSTQTKAEVQLGLQQKLYIADY